MHVCFPSLPSFTPIMLRIVSLSVAIDTHHIECKAHDTMFESMWKFATHENVCLTPGDRFSFSSSVWLLIFLVFFRALVCAPRSPPLHCPIRWFSPLYRLNRTINVLNGASYASVSSLIMFQFFLSRRSKYIHAFGSWLVAGLAGWFALFRSESFFFIMIIYNFNYIRHLTLLFISLQIVFIAHACSV